ncbi:hypothetical protein PIIN_09929 [Serendipita indica DSM 11827]|uniref:Uncharacterized protein n=1 Tax=Serendipita indica (strain DSM 11827) TaxID=1109443 RepID=G4TX90_SERID|nr:hypothetical protein PIIN_09929 [Serendipita indica DSM 11827]
MAKFSIVARSWLLVGIVKSLIVMSFELETIREPSGEIEMVLRNAVKSMQKE